MSEPRPDTLPPRSGGDDRLSGVATMLHAPLWILFLALLYFFVPRFEATMADFGVALSPTARAVVLASHAVTRWWFAIAAALGVLIVIDFLLQGSNLSGAWRSLWALFWLILPLAGLIAAIVAIGMGYAGFVSRLAG